VLRYQLDANGEPIITTNRRELLADDSIGGRAYYLGKIEMELPLGSGIRELGIRPSAFVDVGSVFGVRRPQVTTREAFRDPADGKIKAKCRDGTTGALSFAPAAGCPNTASTIPAFEEVFLGDTWKPRVSVGIGVNWNSPFGPLRIDVAKALVKYDGDDPQLITFNVGTQF
jgi:outer membrane protein insertion porin family